MAEFIEVRTTIEGHERAAALADGILRAGLATSIDIDEAPPGESTWRLTLITTRRHAPALEREIRVVGGHGPIVAHPVAHDVDGYPDWLTGPP
ncbi:hypothetical protein [Nonomuraea sp. SYSU D8015]|uniref:hypothetical protein n=1 Tax=Nonomuraea sp. SYSU D8015 TaxID=2593644 RepID=UPI001660B8E0|nr:hypothetical protein [Nonomuraea sp. SYSU D8015]